MCTRLGAFGNFNTNYAATTAPLAGRKRLGWWAGFGAVLILGLLLSATGYQHGLPYADEPDEVTLWTMGRAYIDPTWNLFQAAQPPGTLTVAALVEQLQIAFGDPYYNISGFVAIMRLLSVIFNLITLGIVMLLARRLGGPIAGLAAGVFWAVLPLANELAKLGGHNMFMTAFFVGSMAAGIEGATRKSLPWIGLSLILAMLSTVFKWQGAAALAMPGLACLTFWPTDRRKLIGSILAYVVIVGAFSYWVLFVVKALSGDTYMPGVKPTSPTPELILVNFWHMVTQVSLSVPVGLVSAVQRPSAGLWNTLVQTSPVVIFTLLPLAALIIAAVVPALRQRLYGQMRLWMFLIVLLVFSFILSFQGAPVFDRHYLAGMTLLAVLGGLGLSLLLQLGGQFVQRQKRSAYALLAILAAVVVLPVVYMGNVSREYNLPLLRPDHRNVFAEWVRTTAVEGPLAIMSAELATAVQTLHGYRGRPIETPYNVDYALLVGTNQLTNEGIISKNIHYLVVSPDTGTGHLTLPMTKLAVDKNVGAGYSGPEWEVWYLGPLPTLSPTPLALFGGEVALRGYSLSKQTVCAGSTVDLQMLWSAPATPTRYYSTYVHLSSDKTHELSEPINGDQLAEGDRPTVTWIKPDEVLIGPKRTWQVRADLPAGDYDVLLGVFEPMSLTRLKLPDGSDHYVLGKLRVENCAAPLTF